VKSTGSTSYPLLQEVIVSFGTKIEMEPTLDAALDELFSGNSGAPTGDQNAQPTSPPTTSTPSPSPGHSSTPSPTATPSPSASANPDLQQAISEAQQAYDDAQTALKQGDWTAYGQAQQRLQQALQKAAAAEGSGGK